MSTVTCQITGWQDTLHQHSTALQKRHCTASTILHCTEIYSTTLQRTVQHDTACPSSDCTVAIQGAVLFCWQKSCSKLLQTLRQWGYHGYHGPAWLSHAAAPPSRRSLATSALDTRTWSGATSWSRTTALSRTAILGGKYIYIYNFLEFTVCDNN